MSFSIIKYPSSGSPTVTADNALTKTLNNIQLGGPLIQNTTISSNTYPLILTGLVAGNSLEVTNSAIGIVSAVTATASDASATGISGFGGNIGVAGASLVGSGMRASATSGTGISASATSGVAGDFQVTPTTTNSVKSITSFERYTTGLAANGIGLSLDFANQTSTGNAQLSNQIISQFSDATNATRTSQLIFTGVNSAVTSTLFTLNGSGALKLNKYGSGTFTGTPTYTLQVDSLGNIIELASATSAINGLSINTGKTVLGQDVGQVGNPAALTSNREIPMGAFTIKHDDTSGNFNTFGAGTLVSTRVASGTNLTTANTVTNNTSTFGFFGTNTTTFGTFSSCSAFNTPIFVVKRFNTVSTGQTITTSVSNRQSVIFSVLQFENDVAATNNPITQSGTNPISVYSSKIDFWPSAGGQTKTITGALCHYSTFLDCSAANSSSIQSYMDFEAGSASGNSSFPITITNRYGFKVRDLNTSGFTITNRWAFYQEGTTDSNYFAGFSGFGTSTPTARIHASAGTATAGTAPLKLTAGTNLTTAETGTFEFNGTNLFFTRTGTTRENIVTASAVTTETVVSNTTVTVNINGVTYKLLAFV